jgi:hypothetical protein
MADVDLLVPGTGGNKLLKNREDLGYPALLQGTVSLLAELGLPLHHLVQLLSMGHLPQQIPPHRTTLLPGAVIDAGPLLALAYNQLERSFVPFLYDWRADLRHSGARLLDFLQARKPAGGRWRLVSHSQGGLVTVVASKLCAEQNGGDPTAFSRLVRDVIMVGVPLYGTLNAAHALVQGNQLGTQASPSFRIIARTWPALYQMLPDWKGALRLPDGTPAPQGVLQAAAWRAYDGISPDLLARALYTRQTYLRYPLSRMSGVKVAILLTRNLGTWDAATVLPDGTIDFGPRSGEGDALVPADPTRRRMTPVELATLHEVRPDQPIADHAMLLNDAFIGTLVRDLRGAS